MGVDQTSLDRIRNATFPSARRGYDKREVERFLARLADWLETGGGDESRSDTVKRELERVGQRTGAILSQAEDSAQQIRAEAEEESGQTIQEANAEAERTRAETDSYSKQTRKDADGYAQETRKQAEREERKTVEQAEAQAQRIVDEGTKRRRDIESVIADLVGRRDAVLADIGELSGKLETAIGEHRPPDDADPFREPEEYDPVARGEEELEPAPEDDGAEAGDEEPESEELEPASKDDGAEAEDEEPESEELEVTAEEKEEEPPPKKPRRRRSRRKVKA